MSTSNTLTKTDLANILNEIVAIDGTDMTSQEIDDFVDSLNITQREDYNSWAYITKINFTANNTVAKVTGVTIDSGGSADEFFTIGTDQITVKKSGKYKVSLSFVLSAITTEASVKRLSLYRNSAETTNCLGQKASWDTCTNVAIVSCDVGDVLSMWARAEDGNSTYSSARIIIEPIP